MTNLDKNPTTGGWAWRINIETIHRSMGVLAQFDSGKESHEKGGLSRFSGKNGVDELQAYNGDVSERGTASPPPLCFSSGLFHIPVFKLSGTIMSPLYLALSVTGKACVSLLCFISKSKDLERWLANVVFVEGQLGTV